MTSAHLVRSASLHPVSQLLPIALTVLLPACMSAEPRVITSLSTSLDTSL